MGLVSASNSLCSASACSSTPGLSERQFVPMKTQLPAVCCASSQRVTYRRSRGRSCCRMGKAKQPCRGAWAAVRSTQEFLRLTSVITHGQRQAEFPSSPLFHPPFILHPLPCRQQKTKKPIFMWPEQQNNWMCA